MVSTDSGWHGALGVTAAAATRFRAALVLAGLLGGVLIAEIALQVGALYVRSHVRPDHATWRTKRTRVVCLGDSNTYGVKVPRDQTYPAHLERLWNAATPNHPAEVLNLGFPGLNSSKMRASFRELVSTLRPDIVLVLVGSNDINSEPVPLGARGSTFSRVKYFLWQKSRVVRFLYILAAGLRREPVQDEPVEVRLDYSKTQREGKVRVGDREFDLAGTDRIRGGYSRWWPSLQENLRAMATDAELVGARLVVLTYMSRRSLYGWANEALRDLSGIPVIDLATQVRAVCPDGDCPDIFLPDQHPTGAGYELCAQLVWQGLLEIGVIAHGGRVDLPPLHPRIQRHVEPRGVSPG